jgi:hypothetical protein
MTIQRLGYCGLASTACPSSIAKRIDDQALRVTTAKNWSSITLPVFPENLPREGCTPGIEMHSTGCGHFASRTYAA